MLVEGFTQTSAVEILARTERIANKTPPDALDQTQEILNRFNEQWSSFLRDLFRVYAEALTEMLCDWTSLGAPPPSSVVTLRGLAQDMRSHEPKALSEVFHDRLSQIAAESSLPESRLIDCFSLCQTKWLEAVARRTPIDLVQEEDDDDRVDDSPADEEDDGVYVV